MSRATTIAEDIGWPEGLRWRDGHLWFSDIFGTRMVHRLEADGSVTGIVSVPNCPSGLGWTPDGDLLVVSMDDRRLFRVPSGSSDLVEVCDMSELARVTNDMTVARDGTAYIGDNGFRFGEEPFEKGRILRVDPGGNPSIVAEQMALPNGMVITDGGRTLVVAETLGGRISRFAIDDNGDLGGRETFHAFDDLGWVADVEAVFARSVAPDGICINAEGELWVGNPLDASISCVNDRDEVIEVVELSQPSIACALGGPDRRTLFVATGVISDQSGGRGRIECATVSTPGV